MGPAAATSPLDGASVAKKSPETEEQHLGAGRTAALEDPGAAR